MSGRRIQEQKTGKVARGCVVTLFVGALALLVAPQGDGTCDTLWNKYFGGAGTIQLRP